MTEGDGRWTDADEHHIPELDGILDIDIQWTPLTVSLPINRIPLEAGVEQQIPVAFISLPDLVIVPMIQSFTRIDDFHVRHISPGKPGPNDLRIDEHGYVEDYPGFFSRS